MRLVLFVVLAACGSKSEPVVDTAAASMPLLATDIAPCVFLDKPFANSYTEPHDKPIRQSFQGMTCDDSETDVQLLEFGDAAEAARQAELLRQHLGLEIGRTSPSYSPFAMLTFGGRLALVASPQTSPVVAILVRRGYVDISHALRSPGYLDISHAPRSP